MKLTNEEISQIRDEFLSPPMCDIYTFAREIIKRACCSETYHYEADFVKDAKLRQQAGEE